MCRLCALQDCLLIFYGYYSVEHRLGDLESLPPKQLQNF